MKLVQSGEVTVEKDVVPEEGEDESNKDLRFGEGAEDQVV